jgi:hypothetical protein
VSERQSVIGFTEAELGLFVAVLLIALYTVSPAAPKLPGDMVTVPRDSLDFLNNRIDTLAAQTALLTAQVDTLRNRRSKQRPSCKEKGIIGDFLLDIVVLGPNRYAVNTRELAFKELMALVKTQIDQAASVGCVHSVRVQYRAGIPVDDYDAALKPIQQYFYATLAGRVR